MNRVVEPPSSPSGDELEDLLRAFLRSQLPQPWPPPPSFPAHMSCLPRPANGQNLIRSRWTLAASVALLLLGSWLLPSRFTLKDTTPQRLNGPIISNIPSDTPAKHKIPKHRRNKPEPAFPENKPFPQWNEPNAPLLR